MHNGMLQSSGEKMSKSLGNLVTIDEFLREHTADALRSLVFSGHYRKPVMYTDEIIASAERSLTRLQTALRPSNGRKSVGAEAETLWARPPRRRVSFIEVMDDDFNTAACSGCPLREMVRAVNSARSAGVGGPFFEAAQRTFRSLTGLAVLG
ncbi:MAG: DALR domain-containing protein [Caldilineaceae bacterium]